MTIKAAVDLLSDGGVCDALGDARQIFKRLGGLKDYELFSLSASSERKEVRDAVLRRSRREPLQYIFGEVGFYKENYKVTSECLIPREDTEILVDFAVKNIPCDKTFIDLCTGSGCIALSVLNNTENTRAIMVDISDGALSVAKENSERLGLSERCSLLLADATEPIECGKVYAVLSNPPYVSDSAYENLEKEIYFEPKPAFVGGIDGADFYRKITPLYRNLIDENGFIAYEIGYDQGELLKKIAEKNKMSAEILKDLSGNDRVAVLRIT